MGIDSNYLNTFITSAVDYYSRHPDSIIKILHTVEGDHGMIERPLYDEPLHLFFIHRGEMDGGFPVYGVEDFMGTKGEVPVIASAIQSEGKDVLVTLENISPASPDSRMVYGWRVKSGRIFPLPYPVPTQDGWAVVPGAYFDGIRISVEDMFVDQLSQLLNVAPVGHHLISIMSPMSVDSIVEAALLGKIPPQVNMGSLIETVFLEVEKPSPLVIYGYSDVENILERLRYHPTGAGHIAIRSLSPDVVGECAEIRNYAVRKDGRIQGLMVGAVMADPDVPLNESVESEVMKATSVKFCDPW